MSILQDPSKIIEATPVETLFASRMWFDRWLASFGGDTSGWWRPAGFPLLEFPYVIRARRIGPFSVRVAWGAANSYTPKFDFCGIGTPTAEHLRTMMCDLDVAVLVFPLLSQTSKLAHIAKQPMRGLWLFQDFCETAPFVDCTGSWDDYFESRGKARRRDWLYSERRAIKAGMSVKTLSSWLDIAPYFDEILAVEASGWKGRLGSSIVQDSTLQRFFEGLCQDLAAVDSLRVFLLWSGKRIVAFQICTLHSGVLTSLKIGYLDEYAKESPGQVLQLHIVRWAFAQPDIRIYDLLGPVSPTKLKWSTGVDELSTIYVFRQSLQGVVARIRWAVAPLAKAWVKQQLAKVNRKASGHADTITVSRGASARADMDE